MTALFAASVRWLARHFLLFLVVVLALVIVVKVQQAYSALPALSGQIEALERQEALLGKDVQSQLAAARSSKEKLNELELSALRQRLGQVRANLSKAPGGYSRTRLALDLAGGDAETIARRLGADFQAQLWRREETALVARIGMIERGNRFRTISEHLNDLNIRAAGLQRRIDEIEREHPILSKGERVPLLQGVEGPWLELRAAREELRSVNSRRRQAMAARQTVRTHWQAMNSAYQRGHDEMLAVAQPGPILRQAIDEKKAELSQHWFTRIWAAIAPVLGWGLWITLLVIIVPPATKAFWFFVVAPAASRLRPVIISPESASNVIWASADKGGAVGPQGSGVSRRIAIQPGYELIIKPEYLQSSMNEARIDSKLILNPAIPFGSLATGLVGLTRIRVHKPEFATVSATHDLFDEIGIVHVPEGSALIFKPRNLAGVLQRADRPLQIRSVWRLGSLSAWLTLQLRFLVFEGPCSLIVKGARGIALEPSINGRRIAGTATMGWTPNLAYSVRRSETFLAYLMGKQSLFNDSFEGEGFIVYEEVPRTGARGGIFGRGLEGLGDGLLKVMGL